MVESAGDQGLFTDKDLDLMEAAILRATREHSLEEAFKNRVRGEVQDILLNHARRFIDDFQETLRSEVQKAVGSSDDCAKRVLDGVAGRVVEKYGDHWNDALSRQVLGKATTELANRAQATPEFAALLGSLKTPDTAQMLLSAQMQWVQGEGAAFVREQVVFWSRQVEALQGTIRTLEQKVAQGRR